MAERGTMTYPEIGEQPQALTAALEQLGRQGSWVADCIGNSAYDQVVFIGSGSSYYQAQTMAATYRKWLKRTAVALPSSDVFLLREASVADLQRNLLVGVSRSGESSEVLLALESVKGLPNWDICGITCYEDSSMARMCRCLVSPLGKERSTVMTKSFSSMTFMMQAAIARASGNGTWSAELQQALLLDAVKVAEAEAAARAMVGSRSFSNYIYLGLGALNGVAQEACLKLKEMSNVWTESFGTLEFRHGPKSIVDKGTYLCVLLSEATRDYELKVAEEMKGYGAFVVLLTARGGADTGFADLVVELDGAGLSDEARTVLYLPFLQYVGYFTAMNKGVDPDHPRNLTQVVKI